MCGASVRHVSDMCWTCVEMCWSCVGACLVIVFDLSGIYVGHAWEQLGACWRQNNTRLVLDMFETCLGHVWDMLGTFCGYVWVMFGRCVWDLFRTCLRHVFL